MESKCLRDLIVDAFHYHKPLAENSFQYGQLEDQGDRLLQGITNKNNTSGINSDGCICLEAPLESIKSDSDSFIRYIDDFISGQTKDKYSYALRFDHLIQYLNHIYGLGLSNQFLNKYKYKDADRRRLGILKYLHEDAKGKTQKEIAEQFGIDEKTFRDDINALISGFTFMGTTMMISGLNKSGSIYNSPVHPIFLALNTTQVWSLLLGLKLLSKSTIFESDHSVIANLVYSQLTPFARNIVKTESDKQGVEFSQRDLQFTNTLDHLKDRASKQICHYLRKGEACTIHYFSSDVSHPSKTVVGIPSIYIGDSTNFDHIEVKSDKSSILIKISSIIDISSV